MRHLLSTIIFTTFAVSTAVADMTVQVEQPFFVRSNPDNFDLKDTSNVVNGIQPNQTVKIIDALQKPEGWALKIELPHGKKNESYWIYYDSKNPRMAIWENGKRLSPDRQPVVETPKPVVKKVTTPSADTGSGLRNEPSESGNCINCSVKKDSESAAVAISKIRGAIDEMYPSAFKGALKTMAVMYQSCSALDKKPYPLTSDLSIDKYLTYRSASSSLGHSYKVRTIPSQNLSSLVKTHYYLKDLKGPENSQCKDMRLTPPIYTYGGKPAVSKTEINMLVKQRTSGAAYSGLDCSTFVSTALTAAGLRIKPGQPILENRATSTQLANFTEKNSCFGAPAFTSDSTLQSGDIIAFSGHTFMIDTVGKDPFGFEKMKVRGKQISTKSDCYNLPAKAAQYFDFRIIQSAGLGSLAISRTEASEYISKSKLLGNIEPFMISACLAKVTGQKAAPVRNKRTALLRHRGNEVPGCVIPKNQIPRMTGEECVASCTN